MKTIRNTTTGKYATIVNKGDYGFTVYFGYSNNTNDAYNNDTCTSVKVYKSEQVAMKKARQAIN